MSAATSLLGGSRSIRLDVRTAIVAVGDLAVLSGFIVAGLLSHGISPLDFPRHAAMTLLPFFLGWALVAPLAGAYRPATIETLRGAVGRMTAVWLLASTLGAGIRATPYVHGGAPLEFVLVNAVFGLLFVLPWRLAVLGVLRVRNRS